MAEAKKEAVAPAKAVAEAPKSAAPAAAEVPRRCRVAAVGEWSIRYKATQVYFNQGPSDPVDYDQWIAGQVKAGTLRIVDWV